MKQIENNQGEKNTEIERLDNESNDNRGKVKKFLLYGKSFLPFFLSHHPECENFKEHTLNFGKIKLCIGCFIGYPTAFGALLLIQVLDLGNFFYSPFFLVLSVIFLGTFIFSLVHLTKNKTVKIIQKILIGLGAALLFNWIMKLPNLFRVNLRIAFITFNILLVVLNLYHVYGILGSCYKCNTPFNWGICPGFYNIRIRMKKNRLDDFLLKFNGFSEKILARRAKKKKES
ncbi:MAG: hypothetical protein ACXABO_04900 [Promethearchaeota archaeon]